MESDDTLESLEQDISNIIFKFKEVQMYIGNEKTKLKLWKESLEEQERKIGDEVS